MTYSDFTTITYFDDVTNAKAQALFSIYTTSFIVVLLMVSSHTYITYINTAFIQSKTKKIILPHEELKLK